MDFKTVSKLVNLGKAGGQSAVSQYLRDVQQEIGANAEFHPDWEDNIFEACEILKWDGVEFIKATF